MIDTSTWEEIESAPGNFIGWGEKEGQHVTGTVTQWEPEGGTDYDGNACPRLRVELTEDAASFNGKGERTDYKKGDVVTLNIGQASLQYRVMDVKPPLAVGQEIQIKFVGYQEGKRGQFKAFKLLRNPKTVGQSRFSDTSSNGSDDQPPF